MGPLGIRWARLSMHRDSRSEKQLSAVMAALGRCWPGAVPHSFRIAAGQNSSERTRERPLRGRNGGSCRGAARHHSEGSGLSAIVIWPRSRFPAV